MPAYPLRACITPGCGRLHRTGGPRCEQCRRSKVRQRSKARGPGWTQYDETWRAMAAFILSRDGWTCHYCGKYANTVDHKLPKSRGGLAVPINLVACCKSCNSAKRDKTAEEFVASRARYT